MMTSAERKIPWRTLGGGGPKVVLLHGGPKTARHLNRLALALSGDFTVYLPELSGLDDEPGLLRLDLAHAAEVLEESGAGNVFGVGSGALVALTAAGERPGIERLALYEPPRAHLARPAVRAETLLLRRARFTPYGKGREGELPRVHRVTLHGVGRHGPDDRGRPELVAAELRKFFR
jgi:pimeloyl-ACP methyl ester carboxylesterase